MKARYVPARKGMPMWIAEIWRYPVKSMRGERLDRATLGPGGIEGDRQLFVRLPNGLVATARRYPRLLALSGSTGPGGEALVDGRMWNSPEIGERIAAVTTPGAVLELADESRFDILPLWSPPTAPSPPSAMTAAGCVRTW